MISSAWRHKAIEISGRYGQHDARGEEYMGWPVIKCILIRADIIGDVTERC